MCRRMIWRSRTREPEFLVCRSAFRRDQSLGTRADFGFEQKLSLAFGEHKPELSFAFGEHKPELSLACGEHKPELSLAFGEHKPELSLACGARVTFS